MSGRPLTALAVVLFALSACASGSNTSTTAAPPPPSGESGSLAAPPETIVVEDNIVLNQDEVATTVTEESLEDEEARQAAVNACYAYAQARVDNEAQIDRDINAGRGIASVGASEVIWKRSVRNYYYQTEQSYLFERCMNNKGFSIKELTRF